MKPDIPLVSGNIDTTERLSSVRHFRSKKLQERASLFPHKKCHISITEKIKTDKEQL